MLDSAAVARSALRLLARMEGRSGTAFPMGTPRLSDLTATLAEARVDGDGDPRIRDVTYRSGEARPGALFFAVPGSRTDGHDHVAEAAGRGAVAAIVERPVKAPLLQMVVPSV